MNDSIDAPVAAMLYLAADLMQEHGRTVNEFWHGGVTWHGGPMCTEGAVRVANAMIYDRPHLGEESRTDAFTRAMEALHDEVPEVVSAGGLRVRCVPTWNDRACTGKDEAVAFLRQVAALHDPVLALAELDELVPA